MSDFKLQILIEAHNQQALNALKQVEIAANHLPKIVPIIAQANTAQATTALNSLDHAADQIPQSVPIIAQANTSQATTALNSLDHAADQIPQSVPITAQANTSQATTALNSLDHAADQIPQSVPIIAHVDMSGAIAALDNLSAAIHRIPQHVSVTPQIPVTPQAPIPASNNLSSMAPLAAIAALRYTALGVAAAYVGVQIAKTAHEFEGLRGSLVASMGSEQLAEKTFNAIRDFAQETPYKVDEVTKSFILLKNQGLNASFDMMKAWGNMASATPGKTLDQWVQAIADASRGQFERMPEFGVNMQKLGKDSEKVAITFKGVTTVVKNNANDIQEAFKKISDDNFLHQMDEQMKRLPGVWSNFKDTVDSLWLSIADVGATNIMTQSLQKATSAVQYLADGINTGFFWDVFKIELQTWANDFAQTGQTILGWLDALSTATNLIKADLSSMIIDGVRNWPHAMHTVIAAMLAEIDRIFIAIDRVSLAMSKVGAWTQELDVNIRKSISYSVDAGLASVGMGIGAYIDPLIGTDIKGFATEGMQNADASYNTVTKSEKKLISIKNDLVKQEKELDRRSALIDMGLDATIDNALKKINTRDKALEAARNHNRTEIDQRTAQRQYDRYELNKKLTQDNQELTTKVAAARKKLEDQEKAEKDTKKHKTEHKTEPDIFHWSGLQNEPELSLLEKNERRYEEIMEQYQKAVKAGAKNLPTAAQANVIAAREGLEAEVKAIEEAAQKASGTIKQKTTLKENQVKLGEIKDTAQAQQELRAETQQVASTFQKEYGPQIDALLPKLKGQEDALLRVKVAMTAVAVEGKGNLVENIEKSAQDALNAFNDLSTVLDAQVALNIKNKPAAQQDLLAEANNQRNQFFIKNQAMIDEINHTGSPQDKIKIQKAISQVQMAGANLDQDWLAQMRRGMNAYGNELNGIADLTTKAFSGMEDAFVNFAKGSKDAFKDLANSIIEDLLRMQIRTNIVGPLNNMLQGLLFGGQPTTPIPNLAPGFVSGATSTGPFPNFDLAFGSFPIAHTGGIVGDLTATRIAAHELFKNAPRFHTGGMLEHDEIPIIAKKGEGVFTPAQLRALAPISNKPTVINQTFNYHQRPAIAQNFNDSQNNNDIFNYHQRPAIAQNFNDIQNNNDIFNYHQRPAIAQNFNDSQNTLASEQKNISINQTMHFNISNPEQGFDKKIALAMKHVKNETITAIRKEMRDAGPMFRLARA